MDKSLCLRILLINLGSISLILQVLGLLAHSWFGFFINEGNNGQKVSQRIHGGLLFFSPLSVCKDYGNGPMCNIPGMMSEPEARSYEATNQILSRSVVIQRGLVITGLSASCLGFLMLFVYLFIFKKLFKHRCTGIIAAVFWIFCALPEYIAIGVQIFSNFNMKSSVNVMTLTEEELGINIKIEFITPWAVFLLGGGASLAVITGILIAVTTCKKPMNKTVILYSKVRDGHTDKIQLLGKDVEDDD